MAQLGGATPHRGAPPDPLHAASAPRSALPYAVLGAAVLIVSSAAIMIRLAQAEGIPSLSIAALRLGIAASILTPIVLARGGPEIRSLSRREVLLGAGAGAFLAAHFASWISSLAFTSVASSAALVTTNPIWIAIASWLLFKERPALGLALGIALAFGGSALLFLSDSRAAAHAGSEPLLGNSLALLGSLAICGYLLIGRGLRRRLALLPYIWLVYSSAAVVLVVLALATGNRLAGFSTFGWLMLAGLALGPQLIGHSAVNWALKYVSASFIAVVILGEPIGSALLAWLLLGEVLEVLQFSGFALLLGGIYLAARSERKDAASEQAQAAAES
jgi:drug/metabolite transporter (DMT)-like permease